MNIKVATIPHFSQNLSKSVKNFTKKGRKIPWVSERLFCMHNLSDLGCNCQNEMVNTQNASDIRYWTKNFKLKLEAGERRGENSSFHPQSTNVLLSNTDHVNYFPQ